MTDKTRRTCGKIQSAKHWLTRAEQDLSRESTLRSQMDLLLAEAELKSVKEDLQALPQEKTRKIFQHAVAFCLAAFLCVAFIGGFWWLTQPNLEVNADQVSVSVIQAVPAEAVKAQAPEERKVPQATAVNPSEVRQEAHGSASPVNKEPALTQDEMQRLIRAAGQSLRGQTKP